MTDITDEQIAVLKQALLAAPDLQWGPQTILGLISRLEKAKKKRCPMDFQPVLMAVQSWDITTSKARELLECWEIGTFTDSMLPPCRDLGIGMDADPAEVLMGLRVRLEMAEAERDRYKAMALRAAEDARAIRAEGGQANG